MMSMRDGRHERSIQARVARFLAGPDGSIMGEIATKSAHVVTVAYDRAIARRLAGIGVSWPVWDL